MRKLDFVSLFCAAFVMPIDPKLEAIASDPNWMSFAKALRRCLQAPVEHGFADSNQLLAEVARLRGVGVASLRNPISAITWIEMHFPKALEEENSEIPMTGVLLLSQIYRLNNALGDQWAEKFFRAEVSREKLQSILRALEVRRGGQGVPAHQRIKRTMAYEKEVFEYLAANTQALKMGAQVKVIEKPRTGPIPVDMVVEREGSIVAAIEVKSHRQKTHRRYLLETLAMSSLIARQYHQTILVLPESWGDAILEMADLREQLHVEGVLLGVFQDDQPEQGRGGFQFVNP